MDPGDSRPATDFGYEEVSLAEKGGRVRAVFDSVAAHYDVMNDLMSAGVHRIWKRILLEHLRPRASDLLLDVAGGTGDLADGFLREGGGAAIVLDINEAMLRAGRARPRPLRTTARGRHWLCGDAEALPLPDGAVTAYTIAFGIRNVTRRDLALAEAYRVLKPGGRFLCLEFSLPDVPGLDRLYDWYSFHAIPALGRAVANDAAAYRYLVESIRRFPSAPAFCRMMREARFEHIACDKLSGGVATLYRGWRL